MGLFDRFRNKGDKQNGAEPVAKTGWEDMEPRADVDPEAERQKRKILGAYALGFNGRVNADAIRQHDVTIDAETHADLIDKIAAGQIGGLSQKRELLANIMGPMQDPENARAVLSTISSKHEKRILAAMSPAGFNNWENVSSDDLKAFVAEYPTPMDFQEMSDGFLQEIEKYNGSEKRAEYEAAMTSFMKKVYGKKQEYWEQMRALDKEADTVRDRHERERSAEWIPGDAAVWQTSRSQSENNIVSRENIDHGLIADDSCEDSYFCRPETQLYGVFDGAGGMAGGRLASQITANVLREYSDKYEMKSCSALAAALEDANRRVANDPNAGASTAAVAAVYNRNGRMLLSYASVGDSRIYVVDAAGKARLITEDEGIGRIITNAIGHIKDNGEPTATQFGEIDLHEGDRVVICSDGITGDYGDDLMSETELGNIVRDSHGAMDATKNLLSAARKKDDRTAIVFVPDFKRA